MLSIIKNNIVVNLELLAVLGTFSLLNILCGAIMAATGGQFSWKRLLRGLLKAFLIALITIVYCCGLDVMPYILEKSGIEVPTELATTLEVVGVMIMAIMKYAKEIFEKLKTLIGITEEDVKNIDYKPEVVLPTFEPSIVDYSAEYNVLNIADESKEGLG